MLFKICVMKYIYYLTFVVMKYVLLPIEYHKIYYFKLVIIKYIYYLQ